MRTTLPAAPTSSPVLNKTQNSVPKKTHPKEPSSRIAIQTNSAARKQRRVGNDPTLATFLGRQAKPESSDVLSLLPQQQLGHWHDATARTTERQKARDPGSQEQLQAALSGLADLNANANHDLHAVWYRKRDLLGMSFSLLMHLALLLILALWVKQGVPGQGPMLFLGVEDGVEIQQANFNTQISSIQESLNPLSLLNNNLDLRDNIIPSPKVNKTTSPQPIKIDSPNPSLEVSNSSPTGGGLSGRKAENRPELLKEGGGNDASENAVDMGLQWLAKHQQPDGSWSFKHGQDCTCPNSGNSASKTAATGLALLCFLARNHNHVDESEYQFTVLKGLNYLIKESRNGDLTQLTSSSMYGQGIATLAMAEAYAISKDPALQIPTQQAVDFIVSAQHPLGGWRYLPRQMGDLNVTGWQLMALKTAKISGLAVPEKTLQKATEFVNSQEVSPGGTFFYTGEDPNKARAVPTAIGTLLRFYDGWNRNGDEMRNGMNFLLDHGVSAQNIYFDYYATIVMFHFGGDIWRDWNRQMRDFLINTQDIKGHQRGSWYFEDRKTSAEGGRFFNTAMSILILEVYYRHLRLYDEDALIRGFSLE